MNTTCGECHRARKKHTCDWCGEHIEKGAEYVRWSSFDKKTVRTTKVHFECLAAFDLAVINDLEDGFRHRGCECLRDLGRCYCSRVEQLAYAAEEIRLRGELVRKP